MPLYTSIPSSRGLSQILLAGIYYKPILIHKDLQLPTVREIAINRYKKLHENS